MSTATVAALMVTVVVLALPFVLAALWGRRDRTDGRGRRIDRRWHT